MRPDLDLVIDTFSTVGRPPVTVLRSTRDGSVIAELERADASALFDTGWQPPVRQVVKAADGETDIATVYYAPTRALPGGNHPVIDSAYGGPQVYVAPRNFMEAHLGLFRQAPARHGTAARRAGNQCPGAAPVR